MPNNEREIIPMRRLSLVAVLLALLVISSGVVSAQTVDVDSRLTAYHCPGSSVH